MDDDLKLLLDGWKDLSAAATEGPWARHSFGHGGDPEPSTIAIHTGDFDWDDLESEDSETAVAWMPGADSHQLYDDATFIAASRTLVPHLIAALEAVLEEHPVTRLGCLTHYGRTDCECERRFICATCSVIYPCPTVAAIHAALIGDNDE